MNHYKYLIIGGGMTGDAAVKGIREIDKEGSIGMFSMESNPPYSRPPLTKGLWKNTPEEKIWKKTEEQNAEIHLNTKVSGINPSNNTIILENGSKFTYDKLLLATGGTTIKLPFGEDNIIYYRTYEDYKKVRSLAAEKNNFTIIGGGFIGSEIAAALTMNGKKVTMIFPENGIGTRIFPAGLSGYITNYYRDKGVELVTGDTVSGIENKNGGLILTTKKGQRVNADVVIGGIGIKPDTSLAESAGIKVDNGIVVDELLRTNNLNIYSAGDVASFYNPALGKRMRVEHEDNANKMGKHAGRVMAGDEHPYHHLPFFYSDLFELGYEAVGELDPGLEIFEDWKASGPAEKEKYKEGVVYYLKDGRVKGVLLWNVWGQVDEARKLIAETGPFKASDLKGRLPVKKEK
jgi:3-phenylpropionate/trans-cinnamate dioxygenase ferredoxin reductase subunit